MSFPFYIAKRYLIAKKSQNAINIISWISVLSIAIGTFALVVVLSAFNGLEGLVESLFESFDSDIRIEANSGKVFVPSNISFEELTSLKGVKAYTQVLEEVVGVRYKKQQTIATIKGVEQSYIEMSQIDSNIIEGASTLKYEDLYYAVSGYGIASNLGLYMNQHPENITLYSPKRGKVNSLNPMQSVYRRMIAPGGTFYLSPEYDTKYILVDLKFAQEFLAYENAISSIEVQVEEKVDMEEVVQDIQTIVGSDYNVKSRYQFNEIIYKTNKTEKWITFLILVFILIIAAFNILSSLSMLIIEKKKDVNILSSMGAKLSDIKKIFFFEGMLINLAGALSGLILGTIVCLLQEYVGLVRLEGGIVEFYPVDLNPLELVYILITVLIIGFLTSWYPVQKLARIKTI